jgi:hypothetical protein
MAVVTYRTALLDDITVLDVAHWDKLLRRLLSGQAHANIDFDDLRGLLQRLGFDEDIEGDHYFLRKPGIPDIINIQPQREGKAVTQTVTWSAC